MIGPWQFRFFLIFMFIILAKALPSLGWVMIGAAAAIILVKLLYMMEKLPGRIMDILDRLSNKSEIERKYNKAQEASLVIDAEALAAYMKTKIIGQDEVIDSVAQQLRRRIAASRKDKPKAVFMFAGPPGVGKTYFAKILTEKLYGDQKFLLFYDMSQYSQPHSAASLFGQAKGYVGSTTYGSLTAGLRDFPNSIVLLDEFEKAHPEIHKRFLTAWNDGFITEVSDGSKISTTGAIFVLTTNAAAKKLPELYERYKKGSDNSEFSHAIKTVLQEAGFAPEVLSRIDDFFAFKPLKGLDIARVVALEIEKLVLQYNLTLSDQGIDPAILLEAIEKQKEYSGSGVRELARAIEHKISDGIIDAKTAGAKTISIKSDGHRVFTQIDSYKTEEEQEEDHSSNVARQNAEDAKTATSEAVARVGTDMLNP